MEFEMKKFSVLFFALVLALFCAACGTTTDDDDEGDTGTVENQDNDAADSGNNEGGNGGENGGEEGGNGGEEGDNGGETPDGENGGEEGGNGGEEGETAEYCKESDGVITKIKKGEIALDETVTAKCVVTGIFYAQNNDTHENTAIKGLYVSEILEKAAPNTGIYVFIKETADIDMYEIGDALEVTGTHDEFTPQYYTEPTPQIKAENIVKLGKCALPEPVEISDPSTIATTFEENEASSEKCKWEPNTTTHGKDTKQYEGVLVKITNVEVTNANICHGAFEVTGHLAIDKTLHYYNGNRSKGTKYDSVRGVLIHSYDAYKLAPTKAEDFVEGEVAGGETGEATIKEIQKGEKENLTVEIKNVTVISPVIVNSFDDATKYDFYVSDGTTGDYSGIYIYHVSSDTAIEKGDKVTIKGLVFKFKEKQWEIKGVDSADSITKEGKGTVPAAVEKKAADLKDSDKGTYVKITDELEVKSVDDKGKVTFTNDLTAEGFGKVKLDLSEGDKVKLSGIYDGVYGTMGLFVIDANDVKK